MSSTYIDQKKAKGASLGAVTGESKQTWVLYVFPRGESPSTREAIEDAKSKRPGTQYLSDVTIDDQMLWGIGFSEQIIRVEAEAHR
ncbi:hypothetical protein HW115_14510 [Verrucomicrobiaceae bacterium N1E253]|uniref:Uncharacterized protein n=1 Tax=Oceaniferula marina TaxID=2748318 RepID=A0A851GIQ6_9BACT|nr:hypothetical protein [Oceaniferula marina]